MISLRGYFFGKGERVFPGFSGESRYDFCEGKDYCYLLVNNREPSGRRNDNCFEKRPITQFRLVVVIAVGNDRSIHYDNWLKNKIIQ